MSAHRPPAVHDEVLFFWGLFWGLSDRVDRVSLCFTFRRDAARGEGERWVLTCLASAMGFFSSPCSFTQSLHHLLPSTTTTTTDSELLLVHVWHAAAALSGHLPSDRLHHGLEDEGVQRGEARRLPRREEVSAGCSSAALGLFTMPKPP